MSTFLSAESGCGAGEMTLLRGVGVFVEVDFWAREGCEVLFLARLGALLVVLVFFLLAVDFLVLLVVVLRAIALLLTFHWSFNYSMRALGLYLLGIE